MAADFSNLNLPKLTADDVAKYPSAGVPIERTDFWSNLKSRLHELHQMPDGDVAEQWLSELENKKITPVEDLAPPAISQQVINACVKDRGLLRNIYLYKILYVTGSEKRDHFALFPNFHFKTLISLKP